MPTAECTPPPTLLVVEDEATTRLALVYLLESSGFRVRQASSGAEVPRGLGERPDLILLDVGLPDACGYTLCRNLKSDPATATIPVLLISSLGASAEERVHGLDCGADGYLAKPVDSAELIARVRALVRLARSEASLRESELRYRELFEASPHPMWVHDSETLRFLAVNDAAVGVYGYSRDEFLAMDVTQIRPPGDIPSFLEKVGRPLTAMQSQGVWRHRWKDGTIRQVDICTHALRYGGRSARLVMAIDITERLQAEAALQAARSAAEQGLARLRAVVSNMADGLIVADRAGRLIDWNPMGLRMHGFPDPGADRGRLSVFAETYALSTTSGALLPFRDWPIVRVLQGETITDCELRLRRLQPEEDWIVSYSGSPVHGPGGEVQLGVLTLHDVTARRRAEANLRRTADLLRAVVDGTTDAVFVKNREGRYLLFNEAAAGFVGRPAREVLGKDDTELFTPEGAARVMDRDRRVMETGQAETGEEELTAAGVTRTYLATKAPYRDERGNIAGTIGISRDVTERVRLAAERDELLARLQLQIERMPLACLVCDADLLVTEWNPAAEALFGYRREEVLGRNGFPLIVPPSGMPHAEELLRRLRSGDMTAHSVNQNLTKDGRVITCRWVNTPLIRPDGSFAGLHALAEDVTRQRQAEEALRLRERALESASQGIVLTDPGQPDNPVVYVNPAFERLTGYTRAEVLGRNCRFLQGEAIDRSATSEIRRAIHEGRTCSVELLNYRKDGTPFWNALSVSPVRDEAGKITHFVGVQTDVTERRKLEEQYRQAQKMEVVGRLAGGIAHDFNNLLTVINGYGEMVLSMLPSSEPARDAVAEMLKAGERAAGLTRQLLGFSRQQILAPRVVSLNTVILETKKMLGRVIGEDVELATDLQPALGPVRADPGQLEQMLLNLAVNARDAMPQGGKLTLQTRDVEQPFDDEAVGSPGRYVLLTVGDTGVGMTAEVKGRIFEPFFTTKGSGKGTGLGLATVHGIVTQAGGRIEVDSEIGRGTTFKIYLPRTGDSVHTILRPSAKETIPIARGQETVLLVEDEESVRALSRYVLRDCGYAVLDANGADEAVRLCEHERGPIHLLVSDVVMPGLGGRQLAERLSQLRPGMRVLYLSGYSDDAVIRHGVLEAEVNFLQKPFSAGALARKVREVLDS